MKRSLCWVTWAVLCPTCPLAGRLRGGRKSLLVTAALAQHALTGRLCKVRVATGRQSGRDGEGASGWSCRFSPSRRFAGTYVLGVTPSLGKGFL